MSLHSQLLRGLLALPVMLLLAIAGVIAPAATPSSLPAQDPMTATVTATDVPAPVDTPARAACPHDGDHGPLASR